MIELIKMKVGPGDWRAIGAVIYDNALPFKRPLDKKRYWRERISSIAVIPTYWGRWYDSTKGK